MNPSLQELVEAYAEEPAQGLRHAIVTRAMPLVRSIIGKIRKPDTLLASQEDLESAAIIGVLEALEQYDPGQQNKFNTYAYYRIRGSVVDYLRQIDQLPRLQRQSLGKAKQVMEELSQQLGRMPDDDEMAEAMEMEPDDYRKLLSSIQQRSVLSLDEPEYDESERGAKRSGFIEDPDSPAPDEKINRESEQELLQKHIEQLGERDRMVLSLYYFEDLTLNEIALLLGLSEARISQIVGKLLLELRTRLEQDLSYSE